jgi:hypothetical protein
MPLTTPIELQHGERYGQLTVLKKVKSKRGWRYRCGCACGFGFVIANATQLMKGRVTACLKCTTAAMTTKASTATDYKRKA